MAGPVPKHDHRVGWVELDQVEVLDAVINRQLGTTVGGLDVGSPVGSGKPSRALRSSRVVVAARRCPWWFKADGTHSNRSPLAVEPT